MKNYVQTTLRRRLTIMVAAIFLLVGLAPAVAAAKTAGDLTSYLPSQSELIVGLNVSKLRSSKYYKEALTWARANASDQDFLKIVEGNADFDLSNDLEALVLSIPEAKGDPNNPKRHFTMVANGDFDEKKLVAGLKEEHDDIKKTKKGKRTVYATGEFEFTFLGDGLLWVTAGPESYRDQAWKGLDESKKHSMKANKLLTGLLTDVDTSQGFWLLGDTSKIDAQGAQEKPQPRSVGLSMDITKGLDMKMLTDMPSEDDAKSLVDQVDQLKEGGGHPMMSMVGAGPLLANLSATQDGTKIRANTKMTAPEFDSMIQKVKQLAASQGQMGASPAAPTQTGPKKATPKTDKKSGQGADADFN